MNFLENLRRRPRLIRSVLAVFVLAWLQTAWLPCAMAMTMDMASGHTTQAMSGSSSGSSSDSSIHLAAMPDMPDCIYCPSTHKHSDNSAAAHACFYPHESRVDGGKAQQQQLAQLLAYPVFIGTSILSFLPEPNQALPARYLLAPSAQRPLHLNYCKQLK